MYNIYERRRQSRFDARYWMLGAGALGRPRGMVQGGRRGEGSGWGTHVYLWRIHVDIWQNQYNIVKLKTNKQTNILTVLEIASLLAQTVDNLVAMWASLVKNLPAVQEMQVQSLDWDDPLEEGMTIHSTILA